MDKMNTSAENRKRKMFVEEIKSITNAFEDLNAEVERLRNEKKDILNDIMTQKKAAKPVTEFTLTHGLILIALYEMTKKIINKWM